MHRFWIILLASTAFTASPAIAQQENLPADESTSEEGIVVFGRGETRQVQELTSKELLILAPGTSPLKAIEKLPSVNCGPFRHL